MLLHELTQILVSSKQRQALSEHITVICKHYLQKKKQPKATDKLRTVSDLLYHTVLQMFLTQELHVSTLYISGMKMALY